MTDAKARPNHVGFFLTASARNKKICGSAVNALQEKVDTLPTKMLSLLNRPIINQMFGVRPIGHVARMAALPSVIYTG